MEQLARLGLYYTVVFLLGYITLNAYASVLRLSVREKLWLSPVGFLGGVLCASLIHMFTGGVLFGQNLIYNVFVFFFFGVHLFAGRRAIGEDMAAARACFGRFPKVFKRDHQVFLFKICLFSAAFIFITCLSVNIFMGDVYFRGDLTRHLMFSQQMLNGHPFSHPLPYKEYSGTAYPFLVHAAAAFCVRLFNMDTLDALRLLHLMQAVMLPVGIFTLMLTLTQSFATAFIAMLLSCVYGAYDSQFHPAAWWFNTAIQRMVPGHVTRMLSLGLFCVFLTLVVRDPWTIKTRHRWWLTGIVLGMIGVCHTYAFLFAVLFLFFYWCLMGPKEAKMGLFKIGGIGLLIGMTAYLPSFFNRAPMVEISAASLWEAPRFLFFSIPIGQVFLMPSLVVQHYGMVGLTGGISLLWIRKARFSRFYLALVVTALFLIAVTWIKGVLAVEFQWSLPYHPAQQKIGKLIFLVLVILSGQLISTGMVHLRPKSRSMRHMLKAAIVMFGVYVLVSGIKTTIGFYRQQMLERRFDAGPLAKPSNLLAVVEPLASQDAVIAFPKSIRPDFVYFSGINALILDHPKSFSFDRSLGRGIIYAPNKVCRDIEQRFKIKYEQLLECVLNQYFISHIIVPANRISHYLGFGFLSIHGRGEWVNGRSYVLLKVDNKHGPPKSDKGGGNLDLTALFSSPDFYQLVMGYQPLVRTEYLRPGLIHSRTLEPGGMAWDGQAIWLACTKKKVIYRMSEQTGQILDRIDSPVETPAGIAWDGTGLWIAGAYSGNVVKINPVSKKVEKKIAMGPVRPKGLDWHKGYLFLLNDKKKSSEVLKIDVEKGQVVEAIPSLQRAAGITYRDGFLIGQSPFTLLSYSGSRFDKPAVVYKNLSISPVYWTSSPSRLWCFDLRSRCLVAVSLPLSAKTVK